MPRDVPFGPRLTPAGVAAAAFVWVDAWELPSRLSGPLDGSIGTMVLQFVGRFAITLALVVGAFALARAAVTSRSKAFALLAAGLAASLLNPLLLLGFTSWLPVVSRIHGASSMVVLLWVLPTLWATPFLMISRNAIRPPSDESVDRILFLTGAWMVVTAVLRGGWQLLASSGRRDLVCRGAPCDVGFFNPDLLGILASGLALLLWVFACLRLERRRRWVAAVRAGRVQGWRIVAGDWNGASSLPAMLRVKEGEPHATLLRVSDEIDDPYRSTAPVDAVARVPQSRKAQ